MTIEEIRKAMEDKGCQVLSEIKDQSAPITYICACGLKKSQPFKDFKRRNCRN